jgi:hypothetical protein
VNARNMRSNKYTYQFRRIYFSTFVPGKEVRFFCSV